MKLKADEVFIQHGLKVKQETNLNKDDYEKLILHGALKIMSAKTEMVTFGEDLDIESLIEQGIQKARETNNKKNFATDEVDDLARELGSRPLQRQQL